MPSDTNIDAIGVVTDVLPGSKFKVKLENGGAEVMVYLSGRMRTNSIRVVLGDRVQVEMSPYDLTKGRLSKRL